MQLTGAAVVARSTPELRYISAFTCLLLAVVFAFLRRIEGSSPFAGIGLQTKVPIRQRGEVSG